MQRPHPRYIRLIPTGSLAAIVFVALLALLQSSVAPHFPILGIQPSLVLVAVVLVATIDPGSRSLRWGFLGGLAVDIFSAMPLGTNAILFTLFAFALGAVGQGLDRTHLLFPLLAVAVAVSIYYPLVVVAMGAHGFHVDWDVQVGSRLLPGIAVNVLAGLILYPFVRTLERWTRPPPTARVKGVQ